MNEENDPFAMTPPGSYELSKNDDGGHIDIEKDSVRDNINNLLAAVTASPAISPYTALERVRKVLSQFHINLPAHTFMEGSSGSTTFEINQFGSRIGMTDDGEVVTKGASGFNLYFEYAAQMDGKYAVFAEVVDEDELQEILDDVEEEIEEVEMNEEEIEEDVKEPRGKLKDACWKGYTAVGMKNKNGKKVPNCVPVDEAAVDARGHKSSTGGLTQKGRDHYNNTTGSNLKAPVTTSPSKLDPDSKAANRRKSFCARMGGMEGPMKKPNGEPTRKSLALKKWNCNENADLNEVSTNTLANYKSKALPDEKKRMKELADKYHKDPLRTDPKEGRKWINRNKGLNRAERLLAKNRNKENLKDVYTKEMYIDKRKMKDRDPALNARIKKNSEKKEPEKSDDRHIADKIRAYNKKNIQELHGKGSLEKIEKHHYDRFKDYLRQSDKADRDDPKNAETKAKGYGRVRGTPAGDKAFEPGQKSLEKSLRATRLKLKKGSKMTDTLNEDYKRIILQAIQLQELHGKGSLEKIRGSYEKTHDEKTTKKAAHAWAKLRGNKPKPYDADDEKAMKLSTRKMDRADTLIGRRDWKKTSKKQRSQYQKYTEAYERIIAEAYTKIKLKKSNGEPPAAHFMHEPTPVDKVKKQAKDERNRMIRSLRAKRTK